MEISNLQKTILSKVKKDKARIEEKIKKIEEAGELKIKAIEDKMVKDTMLLHQQLQFHNNTINTIEKDVVATIDDLETLPYKEIPKEV